MKLRIDEPCGENWDNMQIGVFSRHCDVCEKSVIDFTEKSRAEIIEYILSNRNDSVCGRLTPDQFDFHHDDIPILIDTMNRKQTKNPFLILALVCLSLSAYGQQETHIQTPPAIEQSIEIEAPVIHSSGQQREVPKNTKHVMQGEVMIGKVAPPPPPKEEVQQEGERIYQFVEKMPKFKGGTVKMMDYFIQNIQHPGEGHQGNVYVRFIVDKDGAILKPEILRSPSDEMSREVLRLVNKMPKWIPGEQNGKKVSTYMTIPVRFEVR